MGNLRIAIVRKGILLNVNVILRLQEIELVSCNCNIFSLWVSIMYTLILVGLVPHSSVGLVFTTRCNARIASAVLATAIPSVCLSVRLSVTRRYCVNTTARSTVQFALSDSKMCLVL